MTNWHEKQSAEMTRSMVRDQMSEEPLLVSIRITCPQCKRRMILYRTVRCMQCGIYFCENCMKEHIK